jgi:hypothetical protein
MSEQETLVIAELAQLDKDLGAATRTKPVVQLVSNSSPIPPTAWIGTRNLLDGLCPVHIHLTPLSRFAAGKLLQVHEYSFLALIKSKNTGAEDIIPGKYGELAEMNDGGLLRLRLLAVPRSAIMTGSLRNRQRLAEAGGLKLKWLGDSESIWIFDPAYPAQAALAIKLVRPKRKRVLNLTDEQRQVLRDRLHAAGAISLMCAR